MRGEGDRILVDDVVRTALGRKDDWEQHGPGHWGYGVALDVLALERRVAALGRTHPDERGTGDTQDEPVAWAVMSGGRSYDIYDTRGEATAICRWLREEESGDIWRVVPLVPADATPPLHATSDECSVPPECTEIDAMSSASLGSHAAAWAVEHGGDIVYVSIRAHDAQEWAGGGPVDVVPLYRHPQPTLTDAEREAIETAMNAYGEHNDDPECETIEAALWGLLERTK